ncbi:type VII secretion-associated serine protease mycosin [Nocardia tengchongensis]|uniref:type VII secretion-associated serine protease mycosin n=1 Tax=Nocardia tengchongensis TaxID=2055889 RepID=UPI0036968A43
MLPDTDKSQPPPPDRALDLRRVRALSRGAGVTVAIVDTGVSPSSRLPGLTGGGDYMQTGGDGLFDCDAHGTLVAGIIGAAPDPADGFMGVAPEARLVSIRYRSGAFNPDGAVNYDAAQAISVQVRTLARAITHAANLSADVIVVALPICFSAALGVDQSMLAEAIGYAVRTRNALIVTGAGSSSGGGCEQNPAIDPARPADPRNWDGVTTISTPGWFDADVLSVGFTTAAGEPVGDSLTGPWVSLAAPGAGIESLGPGDTGLINGVGAPDKLVAVGGSSFSAAYVAGVAALLKSRFPTEGPADIATRLRASAHAPARGADNAVGAGVIDPLAALSYRTPPLASAGVNRGAVLPIPDPPRPKDWRPAIVALSVVLGSAVLTVVARMVPGWLRRRR